ncbi:hypothetical protein B0J17DRAFT_634195 [Rhizoctonia solani]|nr:hypothetical protein B0J17DRAFT_634195 [Rhizoctonia solani]
MSHIWERSEVHKSSKCIEHVVTLFSDYCQAATTLANLQKKLSRALKDVATVKGTGMVPANAMQASSALFEALGEVDGKLAKLAEKEYDHLSAEVRKHFKKMAKEEKAHDELTFNTNVRLKQASSSYDKKVKGKVPYTAEEHAKHVHLLSTLGNEMAAAKLSHETHISQRHVGVLFAVGASLSRVADACWIGSCEHVKRAGPLIGRIGQWKSLCEGGWAGAVPEDLPDIDKPGSGVIDRAGPGGSPRKDKYSASLTETMTGSTSRSPPLISPFPVTPIPGMGPLNTAAGYFASIAENGDLKPPIAPFSREGMAISNQSSGQSSPGLPYSTAPPPFSTPVPPATPKRRDSQYPPPPQHPASPTRPHAGLPPPSPVRSNAGLPNQPIDGLPPSTPVRSFIDLSDSKGSPIRAPASPVRGPSSPFRPPGSPARAPSSPIRGPLPPAPNPEAAPDSSTNQLIDLSPGTPSPSPKKAGWGTNSWAPMGGGENRAQPPAEEHEPEQTVSISRFLNENKEMGIDVTELEGAAIRENVERMAAAAAAGGASLIDSQPGDTKPLAIGGGMGGAMQVNTSLARRELAFSNNIHGPPPTKPRLASLQPPPSAYPERSGLVSPSLDNIHSSNTGWTGAHANSIVYGSNENASGKHESMRSVWINANSSWKAEIMLHQQYQQFTGSSSSSTALSGTTGVIQHLVPPTVTREYPRRHSTALGIARTQLRDESDTESTSPSGKRSTWVGEVKATECIYTSAQGAAIGKEEFDAGVVAGRRCCFIAGIYGAEIRTLD